MKNRIVKIRTVPFTIGSCIQEARNDYPGYSLQTQLICYINFLLVCTKHGENRWAAMQKLKLITLFTDGCADAWSCEGRNSLGKPFQLSTCLPAGKAPIMMTAIFSTN